MSGLNLVHDVLDAQLIDRRKRKIGRVDSLVLTLADGRPPRVTAILVGGPVRAERVGRWMQLVARAMRALGRVHRQGVSVIPFSLVRCIADTIQVDVDAGGSEAVQAFQVINREAANPSACGTAIVAFRAGEAIGAGRVEGQLVHVVKVTVLAFNNGTGWSMVPETVQYAVLVPDGIEV